jgi:hypothetical protein
VTPYTLRTHMERVEPSSPPQPPPKVGRNGDAGHSLEHDERGYIEIGGPGRSQRWIGLLTYALMLAGVCAILVFLFVRFTGSMRLAIGLVLFMVSYMLLMGWWASRGSDRGQ